FVICDCRFGNEFSQMVDVFEGLKGPIPTGGYGQERWVVKDSKSVSSTACGVTTYQQQRSQISIARRHPSTSSKPSIRSTSTTPVRSSISKRWRRTRRRG